MKYVFSLIDDALEHELWHADQSSEGLQLFFKKIYFFWAMLVSRNLACRMVW
jgi:hypothetical protein